MHTDAHTQVLYFVAVATAAPQGYSYSTSASFSPQDYHHHHDHSLTQAAAVITKNIYFHSAPDETDNEIREINLGPPRKNYRVIFIKAPAPAEPKISLLPAQDEEKTVIYVLSKKTDVSDIQINSEVTPTEPSKPEVFFIKYKTPEEAAHAQRQIQAQYDALGGTSDFSDEGIAPVQSVVGALANIRGTPNLSPSILSNRGYLPPIKKKI